LVASAPDPDNLGSALRGGGRRQGPAAASGRPQNPDGQSAREALEIVCAVYESSRTGRTVTLGR